MLMKNRNRIITIIFLLFGFIAYCLMFNSCKIERKMQVSFKDIQNTFYCELQKNNAMGFEPFYIDSKFFNEVEQQLNELIAESDYCSVMILVNVDNGLLAVRALYNVRDEPYFNIWEQDGFKRLIMIQNPKAVKILRRRPENVVMIDSSLSPAVDRTSTYVIKKIRNKTYYYANYYTKINDAYSSLIKLFREGYESVSYK